MSALGLASLLALASSTVFAEVYNVQFFCTYDGRPVTDTKFWVSDGGKDWQPEEMMTDRGWVRYNIQHPGTYVLTCVAENGQQVKKTIEVTPVSVAVQRSFGDGLKLIGEQSVGMIKVAGDALVIFLPETSVFGRLAAVVAPFIIEKAFRPSKLQISVHPRSQLERAEVGPPSGTYPRNEIADRRAPAQ